LLLHAVVHRADIQDRDGGVLVLGTLFGKFPFLQKLFADGGYQGPQFREAQKKALPCLVTEIVKRSDAAKGFEVLPRRWVVERTLAWLGRCRRLSKNWENLNLCVSKTSSALMRDEVGYRFRSLIDADEVFSIRTVRPASVFVEWTMRTIDRFDPTRMRWSRRDLGEWHL
jgi:transposase